MIKEVKALALAKRHAQYRKQIPVPEWNEDDREPFVVYARAISAQTYGTCKTMATNRETGFFDEAMFMALIVEKCAENFDGSKMFDANDHQHLMTDADGNVLARLADALIKADGNAASIEDQVKN